ncbi:MAG TPA: DUF2171 domain-containing protein [Pseudolabrys sp.]|nr:DUF2171 domain-containing protein [Pseudolabrys sp.]
MCGSDGGHVGTVDCTKDADKIVLTKSNPKSGHHILPLNWVEKVDEKVRPKKSAKDAIAQWQTAAQRRLQDAQRLFISKAVR